MDCRLLTLTGRNGGTALVSRVDGDDYERLKSVPWYLHGNGYAMHQSKRLGSLFLQREVLGLGRAPHRLHVHHINGERLDNRRENLCPLDAYTHREIESGDILIDAVMARAFRVAAVESYGISYLVDNNAP